MLEKGNRANTLHGILLIALFSFAAFYIAELPVVRRLSFSPLIVGIVLGMLYANSLRNHLPETWVPGILFCSKQLLRAGIVLYGFRLTFQSVAAIGAPAIGICAGYCMYALARDIDAKDNETFYRKLQIDGELLGAARPTAVNLRWALERMLARADRTAGPPEQIVQVLERECRAIHREDGEMCRRIAEHGLTLVGEGDGILTHCNAGALAASRYGTALGPILLGQERGKKLRVFADETRPLLQGARLTAWELARAGVEVTLICDNMASMVMKNGWVQACFVGCDRVAANGDTANKIGTSGLAVLARYYNVPFYVLGPTSTIDLDCPTGADIPIEERDGEEIRSLWYQEPMAPAGVRCWDPAFDVTDHSLISAIVTEGGICRPPFGESLRELVSREKGDAP